MLSDTHGKKKFFNLKTTLISIFLVVILLIYLFPNYIEVICLIPFTLLCFSNSKSSILAAVLLTVTWAVYLLFLGSPLYFIIGRYAWLSLFAPLYIILYMDIRKPSPHMINALTYLWDIPLLIWMRIMSNIGSRALQVSI